MCIACQKDPLWRCTAYAALQRWANPVCCSGLLLCKHLIMLDDIEQCPQQAIRSAWTH